MITPPLVVVVGMVREARIVAAEGVLVLIGGGQSARLSKDLHQTLGAGAIGVVSFGLCGALHPGLSVGDVVVECDDRDWLDRLRAALPGARSGRGLGSDTMVVSPKEKFRLYKEYGADIVDMESHVVRARARSAARPYAIIRAVSDAAVRSLPTSVLAGMKPNGETDIMGVVTALARRPWELPALMRTAREAERAFAALEHVRAALGPLLGCRSLDNDA